MNQTSSAESELADLRAQLEAQRARANENLRALVEYQEREERLRADLARVTQERDEARAQALAYLMPEESHRNTALTHERDQLKREVERLRGELHTACMRCGADDDACEMRNMQRRLNAMTEAVRDFMSYYNPRGGVSDVPLGPFERAGGLFPPTDAAESNQSQQVSSPYKLRPDAELEAERAHADELIAALRSAKNGLESHSAPPGIAGIAWMDARMAVDAAIAAHEARHNRKSGEAP